MNDCTTKVCNKCGIEKPLNEFHKSKDNKCGVRTRCKLCRAEIAQKYRDENHDKELIRHRKYAEENHDKEVKRKQLLYLANRQKVIDRTRQWKHDNPEKDAEHNRKWRLSNPEKVKAYSRNRRTKEANASGTHTGDDIKTLYKGQAGKCWYCGVEVGDDYEVDHFIPISKGGSNDAGNLRISCQPCNRKKNSKDPHEWSGRLL